MNLSSRFALFGNRSAENKKTQPPRSVSGADVGLSNLRPIRTTGSSVNPGTKSEQCPPQKRRHMAESSDSDSGTAPSSADSMMDTLLAGQDPGPQHVERLQAAYRKHRRLYRKHSKLAAKASNAMHLATKMLNRALKAQSGKDGEGPPARANQAPSAPDRDADDLECQSDGSGDFSVKSEQHTMDFSSETCVASGTIPPASRFVPGTDSRDSSAARNPPRQGDDKALRASGCAVRAYQFSTLRHKAFQLKPRAAFSCSVGGKAEQKIVAYGMDGTVQIWDPHTQTREASLTRAELGIEYVEDMAQVNSNVLACVPKIVSGDTHTSSVADIVFIGLNPPSTGKQSKATMEAQPWVQSPHVGQISVVSGMSCSPPGHSGRAFILTGGAKDKDIFMWTVETQGARIVSTSATRKMVSDHTARITALCHEPGSNRALAGSANGRVSANDIASGKLIASGAHLSKCAIGSMTLCPTNTNMLMTSSASKSEQVRIYDLRQSISCSKPAITLGIHTPRCQSRYSRSAWHPDGRLVMYPFRDGTSESPRDGLVAIWDTRYARCDTEGPQLYSPHSETIWSICFASARGSGRPTMVTVSSDHCMGFSTFATLQS
ncbi:hypothetical protein IWW39_005672 [Coemansia spiralis]|uniref:Uncharacterized protein n=1 Tax=Coemansia spiralis TaxID=417178 RepID=A0A9W8L271_9FUNG|nr:hypothetical protein IWW39_005672 [Coemansia spiralis]